MTVDIAEDADIGDEETNSVEVASEDTQCIESTTAVYRKRFLMIFIVAIHCTFSCMLQMTLSSVTNIVAEYYRVSPVAVEWLSNIELLCALSCFPLSYFVGRWGVRKMVIMAALLNLLAVTLQYPGYQRHLFALVLASRVPASLAFNTLLLLPVKVSAIWFPPSQRSTATGLALLSIALGNGIGAMQAAFMVLEGDANTVEEGLKKFFLSRLIIAGMLLPLLFFFEERPPKPPSLSQWERKENVNYGENLKTLFKNKNFWIMTHSSILFNVVHMANAVLTNPFITSVFRKGYVKSIGVLGLISDSAAAVCMIVVAIIAGISGRYKLLAIVVNVIPAVAMLCLYIVLTYTHNYTAVFALYAIVGTFIYAYSVVYMEASVETFHPIPEEVIGMPHIILQSWYAISLNTVLGVALAKGYVKLSGFLLVGLYFLCIFLISIMKIEMNRTKVDEVSSEEKIAIIDEKKE